MDLLYAGARDRAVQVTERTEKTEKTERLG